MAVNYYSIYIPLAPYLVCYATRQFMRPGDGALKISKKSEFGMMVLNMLGPLPKGCSPRPPEESYLEIKVNSIYINKVGGNWMSAEKSKLIANWIKRVYENDMQHYLRECKVRFGLEYKYALDKWHEMNGITEDLRKKDSDWHVFFRKKLV